MAVLKFKAARACAIVICTPVWAAVAAPTASTAETSALGKSTPKFGRTLRDSIPGTASVLNGLANNGLEYTSFHNAAVCSPSRAAALTGRNHHSTRLFKKRCAFYPFFIRTTGI